MEIELLHGDVLPSLMHFYTTIRQPMLLRHRTRRLFDIFLYALIRQRPGISFTRAIHRDHIHAFMPPASSGIFLCSLKIGTKFHFSKENT
ncbi:MAG: hypothetical protein IKU73_03010 [Clostridia bacterium]|nr:hypothetical protein [Clostridia bacterium]